MDKYGKDKKSTTRVLSDCFLSCKRKLSNSNSLIQFTTVHTWRHCTLYLIAFSGKELNTFLFITHFPERIAEGVHLKQWQGFLWILWDNPFCGINVEHVQLNRKPRMVLKIDDIWRIMVLMNSLSCFWSSHMPCSSIYHSGTIHEQFTTRLLLNVFMLLLRQRFFLKRLPIKQARMALSRR